jgi:hypothetical protein
MMGCLVVGVTVLQAHGVHEIRTAMDDTGKRTESIPFAARVRASLAAQKLPTELPMKVWVGPGGGKVCNGGETAILRAQTQYELEMPDRGRYRLHAGCYGLWLGEPDSAAILET